VFLKTPKASTDQRVRSLLQKAARRGYSRVVELALARLERSGDKTWLRSRAVVITFEECWPLALSLSIDPGPSSKRAALLNVSSGTKQKDAAGLGALAHAYQEGDQSMLDRVPDRRALKIIAEALKRPDAFFEWLISQTREARADDVIRVAKRYLAVATWQWDKACILAGAFLATVEGVPAIDAAPQQNGEFPFWIALDKHTPDGKLALSKVAKIMNSSHRQLIWASFYCESAHVNRLLPSPWWEAEKAWRLRRAGLSIDGAEELWSRARGIVREQLNDAPAALKKFVETTPPADVTLFQGELLDKGAKP
jgi:hypothetical protein